MTGPIVVHSPPIVGKLGCVFIRNPSPERTNCRLRKNHNRIFATAAHSYESSHVCHKAMLSWRADPRLDRRRSSLCFGMLMSRWQPNESSRYRTHQNRGSDYDPLSSRNVGSLSAIVSTCRGVSQKQNTLSTIAGISPQKLSARCLAADEAFAGKANAFLEKQGVEEISWTDSQF